MAGRGAYWAHSFQACDSFAERARALNARADDPEAGDECSRGPFCSGRRIATGNGERRVIPARTYGAFCTSCQGLIKSCLAELPPAYLRLEAEIPEPHRRGGASPGGAFGPRLPFDASYDSMLRQMSEVLASWCERVRTVARLSVLDTHRSRLRDQGPAVREYAALLGAHMVVLLALEPEPMMRAVPVPSHVAPDQVTILMLGGQDAGEEILAMHRRALLVLGEIVKRREQLDGIPCKRCEEFGLERAEPPSDPAREAMYSECSVCRHQMSKTHFDAWAKWYGGWADRRGLECRRCQLGRHAECEYGNCACGAGQHGFVIDVA